MLGRFPALAGADLEVETGEVLLLSGPNGAGKTTLLRLCAGLLPLRAGAAEVLGVDLAVEPRRVRRAVALVGHETFCYDDLTVAENVRFVARSTGNTAADADDALERVGLQRLAQVAHGRLSQGQRRRLSLANAIARKPRLLLLDEPHAGLDEQGRAVLEEVVQAAPGAGCTVMLASHELDLARRLSTREVRIVAGQVTRYPSIPNRPRPRPATAVPAPAPSGPRDRARGAHMSFLRDALLVAGKDLRIERRSRVALQQIIPFGAIVVMLFAFALDSDRTLLHQAAPGLFWAAVLLAVLLAVGRSFAIEEANRARDGLRLSGLDGGSIFLGKAAAVAVELFLLEIIVGAAVVVLYDISIRGVVVLLCAAVAATVGLAATGTVYGVLAGGLRARETLVPLLVLPAVTPVMLGATRSFQAALESRPGDAWPWVQLLTAFAVLAVTAGTVAFGPLLEEA